MIPFDQVIWNAHQCAEYLGQSYYHFLKKTQWVQGFPARCPVPGKPRWPAKAVTAWALGEIPPKSRQPLAESST